MRKIPKCVRVRIWGFACSGLLLVLISACWLKAFSTEDVNKDEEPEMASQLPLGDSKSEGNVEGLMVPAAVSKDFRVVSALRV